VSGLDTLSAAAAHHHLGLFGAFHPSAEDRTPVGTGTLVLLGPSEPGFWPHVTASPEFMDRAPDPLDRWSARVIGSLAARFDATPLFPFGPPPYRPFFSWALRSGHAWASPVQLLVHAEAGLMVSYRGALALPERLDLPTPPQRPCNTCAGQPCLTACPAGALTQAGYDVPACHTFLDSDAGANCLTTGCAVRRACPISQRYARVAEQSAYHMRLFHR
jgi:epoxyqueuosine reductase